MKGQQEGVILVGGEKTVDGKPVFEPEVLIRKNGSVKYYKLTEMSFGDHAEWLGADTPQSNG